MIDPDKITHDQFDSLAFELRAMGVYVPNRDTAFFHAAVRKWLESIQPRPKKLVMICGVDCHPGDAVCNNYCNSAPQKGPMAKYPPPGPDATT